MVKYKVWRVENEENGKIAKYGTRSLDVKYDQGKGGESSHKEYETKYGMKNQENETKCGSKNIIKVPIKWAWFQENIDSNKNSLYCTWISV